MRCVDVFTHTLILETQPPADSAGHEHALQPVACALWGVAQHGPQTPSSGSHGRGNNRELPRGRLAFVASATELGSQCGDAHGPLAAACITVIHSHRATTRSSPF